MNNLTGNEKLGRILILGLVSLIVAILIQDSVHSLIWIYYVILGVMDIIGVIWILGLLQ